jgi:hypothetical protein
MAKPMKKPKSPAPDSIRELAEFWDTHDLTDFEDELEVVNEPVFVRSTPIKVHLQAGEADAVQRIAQSKGVSQEELVREWVLEKISSGTKDGRTKRPSSTGRTRPTKK